MLKSSLCDHSDAYILLKGTIAITGESRNTIAIRTIAISVAKVSNIDTTGFVLKTTYNKSDLERKINDTDKKIPDTTDLAKNCNNY